MPLSKIQSIGNQVIENLGRRNLIINGAMQVAQRGASFTSTADLYTLDRFAIGHSTVNAMTVTQETDAPSGFQYSLKVLTGTGASSGAAGYGVLRQAIEGTNMYQLKFGTSAAESVTLSFYVKSSLTGTFAVSIRNQAGNRAFAATYTISSANTWEYKTITIAGDTSGTWTADTGIGLHVQFDLGVGSNYDIATGAWTSGSNMFGGESTVKLTETTNATWFLTGLQVEVGKQATPFEHRSYEEEWERCIRYFQRLNLGQWYLNTLGATGAYYSWQLPKIMRAAGTLTEHTAIQYWTGGSAATYSPPTLIGYIDRFTVKRASGMTNFNGFVSGVVNLEAEI
jgi:hypothetical protein